MTRLSPPVVPQEAKTWPTSSWAEVQGTAEPPPSWATTVSVSKIPTTCHSSGIRGPKTDAPTGLWSKRESLKRTSFISLHSKHLLRACPCQVLCWALGRRQGGQGDNQGWGAGGARPAATRGDRRPLGLLQSSLPPSLAPSLLGMICSDTIILHLPG